MNLILKIILKIILISELFVLSLENYFQILFNYFKGFWNYFYLFDLIPEIHLLFKNCFKNSFKFLKIRNNILKLLF